MLPSWAPEPRNWAFWIDLKPNQPFCSPGFLQYFCIPVTKPDPPDIYVQMPKTSIIASNNVVALMARILDFFLDRKTNNACAQFADAQGLFAGLEQEATDAIQCLYAQVSGSIFKIGKRHHLTDDDIEELICDCITICLQKIRTGKYVFQGFSPATFVIEIAKNRARNFRRSALRHYTTELESQREFSDEPDYGTFAETELLEKLLIQLDPNCQNLIRLKYLEERRDKEVIAENLTQYTTVDALKNHRSKCMKKLVEIGAAASLLNQ